MNIENTTAIVTGAGSGIGAATARTLAKAGAHVFIGDINKENGEAVASEIRESGGQADFVYLDVTDQASIEECRDRIEREKGGVDIIANVAGWGITQPFVENSPEFWQRVIDINLMGPIAVIRAFLDKMLERGSGKIVNVSSDAGRVGSLGESVYSGAKGGLISFSKSLAREVSRANITVNCVCPGPTDTPLMAAVPEKIQQAFMRATPMRRLAQPSEVADAILYFSSDQSSFVTGQVLSVSGGLNMCG